jgi:hypothetical protein
VAKSSGLGDNLFVGGFNLSGDISSIKDVSAPMDPLDKTGIDKLAFERIGGLRDGHMSFTSHFNPSTGQAHDVFNNLPTTDVIVSYFRGTTLGNSAASMPGKQINYDGSRGDDGDFTFEVEAQANGFGVEWGQMLTAGAKVHTINEASTGVDQTTVSTVFGWQAYLHVLALTGTNVIVTLQDSADNGTFANLAGGAFTSATAVGAQRLAGGSTATVRRYVRYNLTGTYSSVTLGVSFVRNLTAVAF